MDTSFDARLPMQSKNIAMYLKHSDEIIKNCERSANEYKNYLPYKNSIPSNYENQMLAWAERIHRHVVSHLKQFRKWAQDYLSLERCGITQSEEVALRESWSYTLYLLKELSSEKVRSLAKSTYWQQEFQRIEFQTQLYYMSFAKDIFGK